MTMLNAGTVFDDGSGIRCEVAWSLGVSGVVRLPTFITLVTTVTFASLAAADDVLEHHLVRADSSRRPGAQACVIRTAPKPARTSRSICVFAWARVTERTASSVAPSTSDGPAACAAGASASAATTVENRRIDTLIGSATVAVGWPRGVEDQLKQLPAKPGVYLFRDARRRRPLRREGEVAAAARALVLPEDDGRPRADPQLPARVADIEVIVTGSEVEALHLEQNLVKRHRPPFNVRLRDDKSFPYIAVTVEDEYPRVMFTRERHRRGVWYFGPYANAKKVRETLDVLNRVFPLPAVRRAEAGPALRHPVPRLPHRPLPGAVRRLRLEGGLPRDHRRRDRVPLRRREADPARARAADARGGGRGALRGRGALPQPALAVQHLVERQAVERQSVGTST